MCCKNFIMTAIAVFSVMSVNFSCAEEVIPKYQNLPLDLDLGRIAGNIATAENVLAPEFDGSAADVDLGPILPESVRMRQDSENVKVIASCI